MQGLKVTNIANKGKNITIYAEMGRKEHICICCGTATVEIAVNNGEKIENTLIRGNILGKKIDEDGFEIGGAVFGLFKFNETEFTEDTAILTCESNEIGIFYFENVPYSWLRCSFVMK